MKKNRKFEQDYKPTWLTDIYKVFPPITAEYLFFSATHGAFSRIDIC